MLDKRKIGESKKKQGEHGTGNTLFVEFFRDNPEEMKALDMSRELAIQSNRKQYVIVFLSALHRATVSLGRLPSPTEIANAISSIKERP